MKKLNILVVMYNCSIKDSRTVNSFKKYIPDVLYNYNVNLKITLFNNGPCYIDELEVPDYCEVVQIPKNKSLSSIYNKFIDSDNADFYAFFDHDSSISRHYLDLLFNNVSNSKFPDVMVPILSDSSGKVWSPKVNGIYVDEPVEVSNNSLMAVGSGLCVSSELIKKFRIKFGEVFDSRFFLYGVDTSFFLRLNKISDISAIILPGFSHSFSLREPSDSLSSFRRIERGSEIGLMCRFYENPVAGAVRLLRVGCSCLFRHLTGSSLVVDFYHVLKAYHSGKHYRDK
ncbi:hypothetical protein [Vibrio furnissii]|uniref:hypothetical protein n=1 Tax=Vibrio furnissii TaxID=29494 RepID=UPI003AA94754